MNGESPLLGGAALALGLVLMSPSWAFIVGLVSGMAFAIALGMVFLVVRDRWAPDSGGG